MCIFAEYKDIFGKPREGAHAIRVFDIAIVDLVMTIIAGVLLGNWLGYNVTVVVLILLLLSIPAHMLFGVKTKFIELLSCKDKIEFSNSK